MRRHFSQTFCVVGALLEKNGKILLVQENIHSKKPDAGKWSEPAGWLDVGENPLIGAKREVEEETGFSFIPKAVLGIYSLVRKDLEHEMHAIPHAIKIIFTGEFHTDHQKKLFDDISNIQWFSPEEIFHMDSSVLRDMDIKQLVKDYFSGVRYPLSLLHHCHQQNS